MRTTFTPLLIIFAAFTSHGQAWDSILPLTPIDSKSILQSVETHNVQIKNLGLVKIELLTIKGWDMPGDFLKIEIKCDKYSVSFSNGDGWINRNTRLVFPDETRKMFTEKNELVSDQLLLLTNKTNSFLVLFGWPYASAPGLCTIINLRDGKIMFNRNEELKEISIDKSKLTFVSTRTTNCD